MVTTFTAAAAAAAIRATEDPAVWWTVAIIKYFNDNIGSVASDIRHCDYWHVAFHGAVDWFLKIIFLATMIILSSLFSCCTKWYKRAVDITVPKTRCLVMILPSNVHVAFRGSICSDLVKVSFLVEWVYHKSSTVASTRTIPADSRAACQIYKLIGFFYVFSWSQYDRLLTSHLSACLSVTHFG